MLRLGHVLVLNQPPSCLELTCCSINVIARQDLFMNSIQVARVFVRKYSTAPKSASGFTAKQVGKVGTLDYRVYLFQGSKPISAAHDIPLWADKSKGVLNAVIEIPQGTNAKLEICKEESLNPIWQDRKGSKVRYIADKYPFPYNYGALPQTWENPNIVYHDTQAKGDNDPVDLCEIGSTTLNTGDVVQVKVLGSYAMIDGGETDYKILAINVNDPLATQLNDATDIEKVLPGKLAKYFEFLRDYKIPDGKPANQFAFDGKLLNKEYAMRVIEESHMEWKKLISIKGTSEDFKTECTTLDKSSGATHVISEQDALALVKK